MYWIVGPLSITGDGMIVIEATIESYNQAVLDAIRLKGEETIVIKAPGGRRSLVHCGKVLGSGGIGDVVLAQGSIDNGQDLVSLDNLARRRAVVDRFPKRRWNGKNYAELWLDEPVDTTKLSR